MPAFCCPVALAAVCRARVECRIHANCYCLPGLACFGHASGRSVPHARNRVAASMSAVDPSTDLASAASRMAGTSCGVLLVCVLAALLVTHNESCARDFLMEHPASVPWHDWCTDVISRLAD
ncbi:hypothetical protein C8T65DRAFT_136925 [Cerioporus squamosus]|nr:hypothetical protein C8T65DRAFT_136925 [Cerioporus squamosus]